MPILPEVWAIQQVLTQPERQETLEAWGQRDTGGGVREEEGSMHMHTRAMDISSELEMQTFLHIFKIQNTKTCMTILWSKNI
jgi:hypothetical protein